MRGRKGGGPQSVPLWAVDGLGELADAAGSLAQAAECACVASRTGLTDPMEFMQGTLDVLLLAARDVRATAARLYREAEKEIA